MSDSLDDKLRDIFTQHRMNVQEHDKETLDLECIKLIKQAFADEDKSMEVIALLQKELDKTKSAFLEMHARYRKSGQEFYSRFEKELKTKYDQFVEFADIDMNIYNHGKEAMMLAALESAQKAAGITEAKDG